MKVEIQNIRGIAKAVFETGKMTFLAGLNGSGKSTIIQAIGSALSGRTVPIDGMKKNQAHELIRRGAGEGFVDLDLVVGSVRVGYPGADRKVFGAAPEISEYAAGLASIITDDEKRRADVLAKLLKTSPTQAATMTALEGAGIPQAVAGKVWSTIQSSGWEAVWKQAKDAGAWLKGSWENETGENFGDAKARNWFPAGWESDLATIPDQDLAGAVAAAQDELEQAIAANAVSTVMAADLKNLVDDLPKMIAERQEIAAQLAGLEKTETGMVDTLGKLADPGAVGTPANCPHCKKLLAIKGTRLEILVEKDLAQAEQARKTIEETKAAVERVRAEIRRLKTADHAISANIQKAQDAAAKAAAGPASTPQAADQDRIARARAALATAQARQVMAQKRKKAATIYSLLEYNKKIQVVLAPDGIRLETLRAAIDRFNGRLGELAGIAGWPAVELSSDLSVIVDGKRFHVLSESEKFRASVILQFAMAELDGSKIVLVDKADILDAPGRNGLIKLAMKTNFETVIAMTFSDRATVPDFTRAGGVVYWIENGTVALART